MKPWKIQKFGSDLIYDLRSRGLLPLAVLLLIAIVAAPFAISRMSSSEPEAPTGLAAKKTTAKPAPEGQSAVVTYSPGLRKYNDRLSQRDSKDPFVQQYQVAEDDNVGANGASGDTGTTSTGGSTGTPTITGTTRTTRYWFYYETDIRVGEVGSQLKRIKDVDAFTQLPSQQAPVLVFLGIAEGTKKKQAIFSVSRQVTGVTGQGTCYPDPESCELLGVPAGGGADILYAVDNKLYRIEVDRIKFFRSTQPPD